MSWGLAIVNFDFISLHMIVLDKIRQVTTFCELSVQMSTTIIFISPLDNVYRPYTADIEMMIILLFCTAINLLHILTKIIQFRASSNSNTFRWNRFIQNSAEVCPNNSLWPPFSLLVRLFASPREHFEFLYYWKCIFVHFKRVFGIATKYDFRTSQICLQNCTTHT